MRKRTRRKVYALLNPIDFAISGACITDKESLDGLRIRELAAIDAMSKGLATVTDWQDICELLNLCETMGRNGIGPEVLPICEIAQAEMHAAALRYEKTRRMGLTGTGLKAVRDLFEYHDLQRSSVARSVYEKMIQKTINHVAARGPHVFEIH